MNQPVIRTCLAEWPEITLNGTPDLQAAVRAMLGEDADRYNIEGLTEAYAEAITEGLPVELKLCPDGDLYGPEGAFPQDAIATVRETVPGIDLRGTLAPQFLLRAAYPVDLGPATILQMNALDLLHRLAINPNGAEFHIDRLIFDAGTGRVLVEMTAYDDDGDLTDETFSVMDLRGWAIQ